MSIRSVGWGRLCGWIFARVYEIFLFFLDGGALGKLYGILLGLLDGVVSVEYNGWVVGGL